MSSMWLRSKDERELMQHQEKNHVLCTACLNEMNVDELRKHLFEKHADEFQEVNQCDWKHNRRLSLLAKVAFPTPGNEPPDSDDTDSDDGNAENQKTDRVTRVLNPATSSQQ